MSQICSHLAADLTLQAFRAGDIFSAFLAAGEERRERREERRQLGANRVTELGLLYHDALADEAAATQAAHELAEENAKLRAELAAARGQIATARRSAAAEKARADRAEAAVLAYARRIRGAA